MGKNPKRGKAPALSGGTVAQLDAPRDHNKATPQFCLHHLQPGFDIEGLTRDGRAAFAMALHRRKSMSWLEIIMADKHGLGSENMPRKKFKPAIPAPFQDRDDFLVLRYDGRLPMAGVRSGAVYHIVWIEPEFGKLYDH